MEKTKEEEEEKKTAEGKGFWQMFPYVLAFRLANATPTHASHRLRLGIDSHFLRLGSIPPCVGISIS